MTSRASPSSPADSENDLGSRKRARAVAACDACRTSLKQSSGGRRAEKGTAEETGHRKQACSGGDPCARCHKDSKPCTYGERDPKTALTRARMNQLEQSTIESLWEDLFPALSLDEAIRQYDHAESSLTRDALGLSNGQQANVQQGPLPYNAPEPVHAAPAVTSIPPTRHGSPNRAQEVFLTSGARNYEWDDAGNSVPHLADGGMGSLIHGKGLSYHGLSSAAVYLNAIEKLCPIPIGSGLQDALTWFSALNNGSLAWEDPLTVPGDSPAARTVIPSNGFVIPPLAEVGPFVDSYFRYFHPLTPIVHEPTVRAQLTGAVPMPDTLGNTVLMNMIFAIGALDCGTSSSSATGENYYRAARKALQRGMLDGGSMALVQGVAIMSNYLQRSGKSNAGYMCLGWASRMAMSLGLHLGPGPDGSALDGEMRLRVWWCVVTLEAGCAVTFGRPHPAGAYQLEAAVLPVNCDDEHLTVSSTMRPQSQPYVTLYSPLVYQSRLARVTCAILDRVLHSHSALTVAQLRQYDARVSHVVDATPAAFFDLSYGRFQLSRAIQKWRTKDFRAMLYRPLLLGAAWGSRGRQVSEEVVEAINTCRAISIETLHDIDAFVASTPGISRCFEWYSVFFALQAALTLLLSCLSEPQHADIASWHQVLTLTAQWFRRMTTMASPALAFANLIDSIVANQAPLNLPMQPFTNDDMFLTNDMTMTFDMDRFLLELSGSFPDDGGLMQGSADTH